AAAAQALEEAALAERAARDVEAARAEAQQALDGLRSALDLDARRAELQDGVECSLCGATEHPWAHAAPAFRSLAKEQADRVRALDAARLGADRARLGLDDRREKACAAERALEEARKACADLALEATRAAHALDASAAILDPLLAPRSAWREHIAEQGRAAF